MKKLLATTAMCLVIAAGFGGIASATEASTSSYEATFFVEATAKLTTLTPEISFYKGDFQKITRTMVTNDMYSGMGASLMVSVRALRY